MFGQVRTWDLNARYFDESVRYDSTTIAISRRSTSKYTRKGLTHSVSIVTFKLDWREGGKGLLPNYSVLSRGR